MKHGTEKQMKKQQKPVVIVCILILVLAAVGVGTHFIKKYIPTKERMDLTEYYGQTGEDEMTVILGTDIMETKAVKSGDRVYLPLDMVNTYLNQRYYWDSANQQILYATPSELQYYPASGSGDSEVWLKDDTVYLNLDFIKKYTDLDAYVYDNPSRIAIQHQFTSVNTVTVKKDTSIRYRGGIKSLILTDVSKGTTLLYMEALEDWVQVATMDGYIGYVRKDTLSDMETKDFERDFQKEEYTYLTMEDKVNLSWHQVTTQEANAYLADSIANISGVNVISPTWFYIQDTAGNIGNIASADYVSLAHERGLKVWGLIDNFTADVSTTETLSQLASRQNIIQQLVQAALSVGLDGINVDFESLSEDAGPHFLEFLRELSIECHKNNLVVSVDNPVPEDFTSHYDRKEQGLVVDYIIIMGYDEHYVGSDAGSVASLPWVEQGVQDTVTEVTPERTILAIPFYTRLWKTTGGAVTSEAIGMDEAQNVLSANAVEPVWDGSVGQNYATFEQDNSTYQIWLEDAQSIAEKVKLIPKYNLAGVAQWKLGFENGSIWQTISDNLQAAS
ncbi:MULTISPECIES: glycosyl hydrolase family 18 protein [Blautia]|uniref:Predicted glycosyl hydrolase n=1 Tax=Blautia obeum A2-162 TaxID=657314 RepID=D4LX26_9FIRM|nr:MULTISPECIES: glycosyl hydrolase family 18 protein [Blautia]CBL22179.1 Predicted glycosyl hydrolase [Blautia obeum A2-162]